MIDILSAAWGELYWNTADWLPWLAIQMLVPAFLAVIGRWRFGIRWPYVFLTAYALSLALNVSRLPASPISQAQVAEWNEGLPREYDGVTMRSVTFAHRILTFHASSQYPIDADVVKESGLVGEQCGTFGAFLATRQIKQILYVLSWPEGNYSHAIEARDCQS